jgi:hypothetical protein
MLFAAIFTQLNPDEQVWKNVKERVAKKFPSDEYEMRSLIREALTRLQEMPEIAREFFDHHELAIPRALGGGNTSGLGLPLAMCAVFVP